MQPPAHLKSRRQQKLWEKQQLENAAKRQKQDAENEIPFRQAERRFKARTPLTDLANVIDFRHPEQHSNVVEITLSHDLRSHSQLFGNPEAIDWTKRRLKAYVLTNVPGLIAIPNPFEPEMQRHLVTQCLTSFALPPNKSNLDPHYEIPDTGLWELYAREMAKKKEKNEKTEKVDTTPDRKDVHITKKGTDTHINPSDLIHKLRWITLGYQYDWTTKEYRLDQRYPMSDCLSDLTAAIVKAVEGAGHDNWKNTYPASDFKSEAGVINYYQLRDTLMGHVDRSELNMDAPLVSLSFGHACIYLVGGPTRDTAPVPILLQSGDILIMTGPSRKAYHGVPRILEDTLPSYLVADGTPEWDIYGHYLSTSRINLNIRQVFPNTQDKDIETPPA